MKNVFASFTIRLAVAFLGVFLLTLAACNKDNNSGANGQFAGTFDGTDTTILGSGYDVMVITNGSSANSIKVADQSQAVTFSGTVSGNNITFPYQTINYGYGVLTCVGYGSLTGGKNLYISLIDTSAGIPGTYTFGGTKQ